MIDIIIDNALKTEIFKVFKKDCLKVFSLIYSLKENPNKGKLLGFVGNFAIKELKYGVFRFYFVIDGNKLSLFNVGALEELLIRFMDMSKKHNQQKTIDSIKSILSNLKSSS